MLRRALFALLLVAGLAASAASAGSAFERAVLSRLSRTQVLTYLRAADRALTDSERGAKYLWGAVPPDRTAPAYLGEHWARLTPAQQEEKMVAWFRTHLAAVSLAEVERRIDISALAAAVRREQGDGSFRPWWVGAADTPVTPPPAVAPAAPAVPAARATRPRPAPAARPAPARPVPAAASARPPAPPLRLLDGTAVITPAAPALPAGVPAVTAPVVRDPSVPPAPDAVLPAAPSGALPTTLRNDGS